MAQIEDNRVTFADAAFAAGVSRRAAAISRQRRVVEVELAPGELHPRERIALLEKRLAESEAERLELAQRVFLLNSGWRPDDDD